MSRQAPAALQRFLGQHPAALRSVHWHSDGRAPGHLELETKHGQVVVFAHDTPMFFQHPPQPPGIQAARRWTDLTDSVPEAFNGRPVITGVTLEEDSPTARRWRIALSTGTSIVFELDPDNPLLHTG